MAAHAYFDKVMTKDQAGAVIARYGGVFLRKKGDKKVFRIDGDGQAMVESVGADKIRVRCYSGACPC